MVDKPNLRIVSGWHAIWDRPHAGSATVLLSKRTKQVSLCQLVSLQMARNDVASLAMSLLNRNTVTRLIIDRVGVYAQVLDDVTRFETVQFTYGGGVIYYLIESDFTPDEIAIIRAKVEGGE